MDAGGAPVASLAAASPEIAALRRLAETLRTSPDRDRVVATMLDAALATAGAARAALLASEGTGPFTPVATAGDGGVPSAFAVDDLADPLWRVALGRGRLAWSASEGEPANPLAALPGWEEGMVVGLPTGGAHLRLLAVAGPVDGTFPPEAADRLELLAVLSAAAIENTELLEQFRSVEELLERALGLSSQLAELTGPDAQRQRLVDSLVEEVGCDGAVLWRRPEGVRSGPAILTHWAGVPEDVRAKIAVKASDTPVAKLLDPGVTPALQKALERLSPSTWEGRTKRIVPVPPPERAVLGVYHRQDLPELLRGVLATLAHALAQALASAVGQHLIHGERAALIEGFRRELRPQEITLPDGAEIAEWYRAATVGPDGFGGDFYDWFETTNGHLGIAVGDVAGKGIDAASLSAMAVWSLRAFALQGASPQVVATMLDRFLAAQLGDDRFVTLAYARIDPPDWTARLVLAGHPPPVLVTADGAEVIDADGDTPLGLEEAAGYRQVDIVLEPGSHLVLYSDGVTEARGPNGELFGVERLCEALSGLHGANAAKVADAVSAAVTMWSGQRTTDDTTILVLTRPTQPVTALDE